MRKPVFFWLTFSYVLIFIALPPVFFQISGGGRADVLPARYPPEVFAEALIVFLIYCLSMRGRIFGRGFLRRRMPFFVYSSNALICFGLLCLSSVFFEFLTWLLGIEGGVRKIMRPEGFTGAVNFFMGLSASCLIEEVVYRFFLPAALKDIVFGVFRSKKPKLSVLCECLSLLLFACGHIYLGIPGVLNALLGGAALRLCIIRTGSIWPPFLSHLLYNFLSSVVFMSL